MSPAMNGMRAGRTRHTPRDRLCHKSFGGARSDISGIEFAERGPSPHPLSVRKGRGTARACAPHDARRNRVRNRTRLNLSPPFCGESRIAPAMRSIVRRDPGEGQGKMPTRTKDRATPLIETQQKGPHEAGLFNLQCRDRLSADCRRSAGCACRRLRGPRSWSRKRCGRPGRGQRPNPAPRRRLRSPAAR